MLKKFYRTIHVSRDIVKINKRFLFDKKRFRFLDLSKVKPNLIILGSQKCGTTSLHNYLNEHPDIFMSTPIKEPGYYMFDNWSKNYWNTKGVNVKTKQELLIEHMLKGYAGQPYFGESSTYYTQDEREIQYQIPEHIINEIGIPKFIYIIRNPLERLVSVFYHIKKFNGYKESFEHMLSSDKSYLNTSLYFSRLKAYVDVFGKENIKLVFFQDLVKQPHLLMSEIYNFLELGDYQHSGFKRFNNTSPKQKVKFTTISFQAIIGPIKKEKILLEKQFNLNLDWNLAKEDWVL